MATDLETKPGVPKYEAFVEKQLAKVRGRIRALDSGRSLLLLGVVTLAYFLLMAVFDLALKGADDLLWDGIRLGAFGCYAVLVVLLFGQLCVRLYWRINPYYAARQLEETLPDAKNSVINWLDLKNQALPGAIRNAVGQRAARALKQTDPDKAVDPKGNWLLGGIFAALVLGLVVLFSLGPNQFTSLLQRAFTPFFKNGLATKTEITLLRPLGGDATVPLNQRVEFQARIDGRFPKLGRPGAPRILYRYQRSDTHVSVPLEDVPDGTWTATLLAEQVQNGFWYKIAAGDTETPEYQVKVQSAPQPLKYEVTYHYRRYRKLADDVVFFPNERAVLPRLRDYRGTEVKLVVRTNRELRTARVETESQGAKKMIPGEILVDDPRAMRVNLTLEQRGTFRVYFTSRDGEENSDRGAYQIEVLDDEAPRVTLTKPGQDTVLPANGTLQLEGTARDDIGIKAMELHLKVLAGDIKPALQPKAYREGKSFQFDNGTYPDYLEYKDFVALDKLTTAAKEPFPLKTGMVLEYWLEARDNSDYPNTNGNVGKSAVYKLTIADLSKDEKKQQKERTDAGNEQKKHEQKQDQENAKENAKRREEQANNDPAEQKRREKEFQEKLNELADKDKQAKQKEQEEKQKGEAKGQDPKPAETKPGEAGEQNKADQKAADNPGQAGEKKAEGKHGESPGQTKDQGAPQPKEQPESKQGQAKEGPGAGEKKSAQAKPSGANSPQAEKGSDKGMGKKQGQEQPGETKPGETKNEGKPTETKVSSSKGDGANQTNASAPDKISQAKGDNGTPKADAKAGGQAPHAAQQKAMGKGPSPSQPNVKNADPAQAQGSGQAKGEKAPERDPGAATAKDVADLKDKLKRKEQADAASKELARISKEAKDPEVRKAAAQTLEKAGQGATQEATAKKDNAPTQAGELAKTSEPKDGVDTAPGEKQGTSGKEAKEPNKGNGTVGNFGEGGKGATDEVSKKAAEFGKGGDLQLEELKKVMTPEKLKKYGWSDEDWQKFLKDAQAYQDRLRQLDARKTAANDRGLPAQFSGSKLRQVDMERNAQSDPLQIERAQIPPELREAQRQFTTTPFPKKKE